MHERLRLHSIGVPTDNFYDRGTSAHGEGKLVDPYCSRPETKRVTTAAVLLLGVLVLVEASKQDERPLYLSYPEQVL